MASVEEVCLERQPKLKKVYRKLVTRVAEQTIWDQEVAFAGMGPNLKYIFDINGLRRGTWWNRM